MSTHSRQRRNVQIASLHGEQGLSLTSALLGMFIMIAVVGLATKTNLHTQAIERQNLVAVYYEFLGNTLANAKNVPAKPSQWASKGLVPEEMMNNGNLNKDLLGNTPQLVANTNGSAPIIVSSGAAPLTEINQIAHMKAFGVSGGACGNQTVCSGAGQYSGWSTPVGNVPNGYAYYGYSS